MVKMAMQVLLTAWLFFLALTLAHSAWLSLTFAHWLVAVLSCAHSRSCSPLTCALARSCSLWLSLLFTCALVRSRSLCLALTHFRSLTFARLLVRSLMLDCALVYLLAQSGSLSLASHAAYLFSLALSGTSKPWNELALSHHSPLFLTPADDIDWGDDNDEEEGDEEHRGRGGSAWEALADKIGDDGEVVIANNNRVHVDIESFKVEDYDELRQDEAILYDSGAAWNNLKKNGCQQFILSELASERADRLTAFGAEVACKRPSRGAGTPPTKTWFSAQKEIRDKIVSCVHTTSSFTRPIITSHSQYYLTVKSDCLDFAGSSTEISRRRMLHDFQTKQAMTFAMVLAQDKFPNNHQLQDEYCAMLKKERTKALQVRMRMASFIMFML